MNSPASSQRLEVRFRRARRNLATGIALSVIGIYLAVMLSPEDNGTRLLVSTIIAPIPAAVATGFAAIVVKRQGLGGLFGKTYFALALGLALFLAGEVVWSYNVVVLGIEVPFPSVADALWLSGYAPFGYAFYFLSKMSTGRSNRRSTIIVSVAVFAFSLLYIQQILAVSEAPSDLDSFLVISISIAYPVLDAFLVIPALIAVLSAGKGYLTSVPWIFIAWIFYVVADSLFGYTAVVGFEGDFSISDAYYNVAYLCMAAGMAWHNRYLIFDEKKFKNMAHDLKGQKLK